MPTFVDNPMFDASYEVTTEDTEQLAREFESVEVDAFASKISPSQFAKISLTLETQQSVDLEKVEKMKEFMKQTEEHLVHIQGRRVALKKEKKRISDALTKSNLEQKLSKAQICTYAEEKKAAIAKIKYEAEEKKTAIAKTKYEVAKAKHEAALAKQEQLTKEVEMFCLTP